MNSDTTSLFDIEEINDQVVHETLQEVCENLEERGYNPINQLVGYLMSGDLGYISSYKESRNKIARVDRSALIESILRKYINK